MKPLLFVAEHGTMGDLKPVVILAVIAARSSKMLVTLVHEDEKQFRFLEKLVHFMLGKNPSNFQVLKLSEFDTSTMDQYISFGASFAYTCKLDFGDNGFKNRFVSCLFSKHASHMAHFGSLYLPSRITWSNPHVLQELQEFREYHRNRNIMIFAGSLRLPISYKELFMWLENNPNQTSWAFILIGYHNLDAIPGMFFASKELMDKYFHNPNDNLLFLKDYVEFEDIVKYGDFIMTNCGAGSAFVPLVQGIAETCGWVGDDYISGYDKKHNFETLGELGVGPGKRLPIHKVLQDAEDNFQKYTENAQKASSFIKQETELMFQNMDEFFELLSTNIEMQNILETTGKIPEIFALPDCLSHKRHKQK
jgi:hypothetical protein